MFAACVSLIAWGLTRKKASAEELYVAAEPLMRSDQPAEWRRAWIDYLEPLTIEFPANAHRDEIAAFQRKMQDVERLDKALKLSAAEAPRSEAERFYRRGLADLQNGNEAGAREVWKNVVRSFGGVASERRWVDLAERGLGRLGEPPGGDRFMSAREALAEARQQRDAGKRADATRIWDGLESLYRNDPAARAILDEIQADRAK
jgi:hypothetical protein